LAIPPQESANFKNHFHIKEKPSADQNFTEGIRITETEPISIDTSGAY